jgi:hypothetical protein
VGRNQPFGGACCCHAEMCSFRNRAGYYIKVNKEDDHGLKVKR